MQKWIYSQKPRKPFSKERTPGYDTLPGHSNDEFSDGGLPSQNMESIDERISGESGKVVLSMAFVNWYGLQDLSARQTQNQNQESNMSWNMESHLRRVPMRPSLSNQFLRSTGAYCYYDKFINRKVIATKPFLATIN
ncbi:MAG: hypothetical protein IPH20_12005 [Bacteroidales bacterium]|nr:hypothetical protein [Bacteroidales bacterium]